MTAIPEATPARRRFSVRADGALAVVVLAIVAILVVPLPALVLDFLIAANLAFSVLALLVTLYVPRAVQLSSFPSLLLVAALGRVSLGVAATRLILAHANAGSVIAAFGGLVARGNFVVGVVLFSIITIVEFVVVARGSERVAEVAARFTLDSLPGKQMAIDAEARSGAIDADEARRRRAALERESHFFGAMDGAMKFVKGDVVASVVIAVVNLAGGFAVGVGQRGMEWADAVRRYGVLTIGAGLVAQIPALLLATAAGVLVTRVAADEAGTTLGVDLEAQIFGSARALGIAAWFVAGLALVPGLPTVPFAVIATLLFVLSRRRKSERRSEDALFSAEGAPEDRTAFAPLAVPWSLELSRDVGALLGRRAEDRAEVADRIRRRVFAERGVALPPGRIVVDDSLPDRHALLAIHEVPAKLMTLPPELPAVDAARAVEEQSAPLLVERAADFLGIAETKLLVDELEKRSPATVRQSVPKPIELPLLADVLRRLVDEGLSVRDLKGILEALLRAPAVERDGATLTEHVRAEMRRSLTYSLTSGSEKLRAYVLDGAIEEAIRGSITRGTSETFVSLAPAAVRDIVSAVDQTVGENDAAVLLVPSDIRRHVRELLETDFPRLRVVAHGEILPEIVIEPLGTVTLPKDG